MCIKCVSVCALVHTYVYKMCECVCIGTYVLMCIKCECVCALVHTYVYKMCVCVCIGTYLRV